MSHSIIVNVYCDMCNVVMTTHLPQKVCWLHWAGRWRETVSARIPREALGKGRGREGSSSHFLLPRGSAYQGTRSWSTQTRSSSVSNCSAQVSHPSPLLKQSRTDDHVITHGLKIAIFGTEITCFYTTIIRKLKKCTILNPTLTSPGL